MTKHLKVKNELNNGHHALCGQSNAHLTSTKSLVTCKRCQQKLANIPLFPNAGILRAHG
jgi:hypothetical protein